MHEDDRQLDAPVPTGERESCRYVIERVIGAGSMGIVYRAHDRVLGRPVAVKTLREELLARDHPYGGYRERFCREARIFGSLSHPNIVSLYDVGETVDEIPFLVMEYVPHASLAGLPHSLALDQVMWLLAQLANAIDYAHSRGVIHRDIKPSNILIGDGEEAKIADFGVAKLLGSEFTRSQTQFGTPGYMSPEQVMGKPLTNTSDLFSLGAVAFELLSGENPFPGTDVHDILYKLVQSDPIRPTRLDERGLSATKWDDVFAVALAKDPQNRYESAAKLVSELVELCPGSWLGHVLSERPAPPEFDFTELEDPDTWTLWSM